MARLTGTAGNDILTGSSQADIIDIRQGGSDIVRGLGGYDVIHAGAAFDESDRIEGGGQYHDRLVLRGDYSAGLQVSSTMIGDLDNVSLTGDFVYKLVFDDSIVPAHRLEVRADGITGTGRAIVDCSALDYLQDWSEPSVFFVDSIGNDRFSGSGGRDYFQATHGGRDILKGNGGGDWFSMGGALDASDRIDGGNDDRATLELDGDYSAGLVFDADTVVGVKYFSLYGDNAYDITFSDGTVAAGSYASVSAGLTSKRVEIDGSAETDGSFFFNDNPGNTIFKGGAGDDYASMTTGYDQFHGGGGDDIVIFSEKFALRDFFDGGDGDDIMKIVGFSGEMTLSDANLVSVETVELYGSYDSSITAKDSLVAAGETLAFSYSFEYSWRISDHRFNGSAETDGRFVLVGGSGDDVLRGGAVNDSITGGKGTDKLMGGAGNDTLIGGLGQDNLYGGANDDRFVFTEVAESTGAGADWIRDWNAGDTIDLSAIDANITVAGVQDFSYIGSAAFSSAGQLRAITTDSQNTIVSGDINGDGSADFMIKLSGAQSLSEGSFIV